MRRRPPHFAVLVVSWIAASAIASRPSSVRSGNRRSKPQVDVDVATFRYWFPTCVRLPSSTG
jgi:hypothetical protein